MKDLQPPQYLLSQVLGGRAALQVIVDEWIDEYKKDREKAVVDLIQFFVQCCGCRGENLLT